MSLSESYIRDVMANVFATPQERGRFEADLRSHFAEAEDSGEPSARVIESMGAAENVAAAFNADREIRYAGFWQRTVAFFGDCGLLLLCALPPVAIAIFSSRRLAEPGETSAGTIIPISIVGWVLFGLFVFYFPLLEWRFGKTLGKHLLGLRAVRENGSPMGLGQAFVRRLSLYFEMLMIDALFIPFTEKKQRALDIIAKTVVAHEPGRRPTWSGYAICLLLPLAVLLGLLGLVALCAPLGLELAAE